MDAVPPRVDSERQEDEARSREVRTWSGGLMGTNMPAGRIRLDGKAASIGLGPYPVVTLARARQKALPHAQVGEALARVRASRAHRATALAFEFFVFTACRSGEVRGARWVEVDEAAPTGRCRRHA